MRLVCLFSSLIIFAACGDGNLDDSSESGGSLGLRDDQEETTSGVQENEYVPHKCEVKLGIVI